MKVTTERLEDCQINVIVELDAAEADKRLRQTARQISRQFTVPGYRKGKAPLAAVLRTFGREAIQQQAVDDWGQDLYEEALKEIDYEPYEVGELQDVEWDPFRMTVLLPISPEAELGDYRSVRVVYEAEAVTDEQVEEYLSGLQSENSQWVPVERAAALGDQVTVDFEAHVDDELISSQEAYELVLEADMSLPFPGFHEEIVGMSPGEERIFELTLSEADPDEAAAGEEATVTARLHTVKEEELPPLDDELAMMVGDYDTLDDLRAGVREQLETEAAQKANAEYVDQALDAFVDAAEKLEYPPQAVDREVKSTLSQMEGNLASSGIKLDTYLGAIGKTRAMYEQEMRLSAEERLKKRLVLDEIAKQEDLQVEPDEVEAQIERMVEPLGPQAEEMRQTLDSPNGRTMVTNDLLVTKAQERAIQIAKGEAPPLAARKEEVEPKDAIDSDVEAEANTQVEAGVAEEAETTAEGTEESAAEVVVDETIEEADDEPDSNEDS